MEIGKLNLRVTIQAPTNSMDNFGQRQTQWHTVGQPFYWAHIRPTGSSETLAAAQIQSGQTHVATLRYQPDLTIVDGTHRLVNGSQIFGIVGYPRNLAGSKTHLIFDLKQGAPHVA